jgi:hypothetical protein
MQANRAEINGALHISMLAGAEGRDLGCNGFELAPEFAHIPVFLREIRGRSTRFALCDDLPMQAISLHATF